MRLKRLAHKEGFLDSFEHIYKKLEKTAFRTVAAPLLSFHLLFSSPSLPLVEKPADKNLSIKLNDKTLTGKWSMGECIFNEKDWSLTYKSEKEINEKKEARIDLDRINGVGSPEKIVCNDIHSYILTPTHVIITLGGLSVFGDQIALGLLGDEFIISNTIALDITPIAKQQILLSLVVFDNKVINDESGTKIVTRDDLYLFTRTGKLWVIPLTTSSKASCAFTAKYPPTGNAALIAYKGLVILAKEGNENIILIEDAKDENEFRINKVESKEWVKGKIFIKEIDDSIRIRIGWKEYIIKVAEEGKAESATINEKVYKEKKKIKEREHHDNG